MHGGVSGDGRLRFRARRLVASAVLALAVAAGVAFAASNDTTLISRATGADGAPGNRGSIEPAISAAGRFVAFVSEATNLSPADRDSILDVFVRDTSTGTTTLVSRANGIDGAKGTRRSIEPAISADGRFVAFVSVATNLSRADRDSTKDVFVRDTRTNRTTLVSRATGARGAAARSDANEPAISADGRFVAFWSAATNLSRADRDLTEDVFVRDTRTNRTTLVSRATGARGAAANCCSSNPAISADGRFVAFSSGATNLDPAASGRFDDEVYVRDTRSSTTTLVSRASGARGAAPNAGSGGPAISGDGRFVAFASKASNLDPADRDRGSDVYLRDTTTSTTTLISRATGAAGAKGDLDSLELTISADGRFVAFASAAENLDPAATAPPGGERLGTRVYVRDTRTSTTALVSRETGASGAVANQSSLDPAISADGRFVAFKSEATNLGAGGGLNVFVRELDLGAR